MIFGGVLLLVCAVQEPIHPVAQKYCSGCHGAKKQEAELNLVAFLGSPAAYPKAGATFRDVIAALEEGEMPPKKAKAKPSPRERAELLAWVKAQRDALAARQKDDPGHVVMSRLTGYEYRNILRDLSGGVVRRAGRNLPLVLAGHGGGSIAGGRTLDFTDRPEVEQRACNLYLALARRMGVRIDTFGDSVAPLKGI